MGPWTFSPSFIVAGTGPFPVDMLRFDQCWPQSGADAAAIALDTRDMHARESRRCVTLCTGRRFGATIRRWESFGWRVISHDEIGNALHPDDLAAVRARWQPQPVAA